VTTDDDAAVSRDQSETFSLGVSNVTGPRDSTVQKQLSQRMKLRRKTPWMPISQNDDDIDDDDDDDDDYEADEDEFVTKVEQNVTARQGARDVSAMTLS